MEVARSFDSS